MQKWLRQVPNVISSLRLLLLLPIGWALLHRRLDLTLWLFLAAAVSDAADGFLARRFNWLTDAGALIDPLADKLMLATVFVAMTWVGWVPLWLTVAVLARDVVIITGALLYRLIIGAVKGNPSRVSKLNTLCQMAFVLSVITNRRYAIPPSWTVLALGALVFVTVAVSGLDYVLVYGRRAASARHRDGLGGGRGPEHA